MADFKGTDLKLFVKTASAPSTLDITTDYSEVGYITDLAINTTRTAIETSSKTDGDNSTFIGGRRNWTIDLSCIYDKESDAGQLVFQTALDDDATTPGKVWFLITSQTVGDDEWYGNGIVTSHSVSAPDNDVVTLSATIQGSGALTMQSAASTT